MWQIDLFPTLGPDTIKWGPTILGAILGGFLVGAQWEKHRKSRKTEETQGQGG